MDRKNSNFKVISTVMESSNCKTLNLVKPFTNSKQITHELGDQKASTLSNKKPIVQATNISKIRNSLFTHSPTIQATQEYKSMLEPFRRTITSQPVKIDRPLSRNNSNKTLPNCSKLKNGTDASKSLSSYNCQPYNQWKQDRTSKLKEALKCKPLNDKILPVTKDKDLPLEISCFEVATVQYNTLYMLYIGVEKSSDFVTCRRFLASAINRPSTILTMLVAIVESLKDLDLCTCALRILYKIILFASFQKKIPMDDIFHNFTNVTVLIDTLAILHVKYEDSKKYKEIQTEWHVKILHIIQILSNEKQWKVKLRYLKKSSVEYLGKLVANKSPHVDLVNYLLAIIKLISADKNNCQILSNKGFYLGLCDAFTLTRKINTITDIFQYFFKIKTITKYLQQRDEVLSLFIDMIAYNAGKFLVTKRKIMDMLYRLSANNIAILKILRLDEYFLKLLFYFMRKGKTYEYGSQIKAFSLLNRSVKHVRLPDEVVDLGFALPSRLIPSVKESKSSDEDDSEESEEESTEYCETNIKGDELMDEPLTNVSPYFIELLECRCTSENRSFQSCCEKNCVTKIKQQLHFDNSDYFSGKVYRLEKINQNAYPDLLTTDPVPYNEFVVHPKCDSSTTLLSQKLRSLRAGVKTKFSPMVVFDLDLLYKRNAPFQIVHPKPFLTIKTQNADPSNRLIFESRFECGNLRKAIQIEQFEYELYLSPDTYTTKGFQWFYFEVANMLAGVQYSFNIINFCKSKVLYMEGMRPLMFSVFDHQLSHVGWKRAPGKVIYYSNHYTNKTDEVEYKTLSFSLTFPHSNDFVYFAYHYPYTYSRLTRLLTPLNEFSSDKIYLKLDKLCSTINNFNEVPLLTITARSLSDGSFEIPYKKRSIIFLTGRVHPGESNSSWIMEGIIKFLLNENDVNATIARQHYIFKIVPMLNPEGVIYGNTRRGLTGIDLNRCWSSPSKDICPEIYYTKRLVAFAKTEIKHPVAAFIDIHGHSKKKFFFLYGCNPKLSWDKADKKRGDWSDMLAIIPNAIHTINPNMQVDYCQNQIMKHKESTARVVFWREFNIKHSYTLECTYSEVANKLSVNTKVLSDIGSSLVTAFGNTARQAFRLRRTIPSLSLDYGEWVTRENIVNEQLVLKNDRGLISSRSSRKKDTVKNSTVATVIIPVKFRNASTTTLTLTEIANTSTIETLKENN